MEYLDKYPDNFFGRFFVVDREREQEYNWNACGPLAQLVEHLTLNQGVLGSNPRWPTILNIDE